MVTLHASNSGPSDYGAKISIHHKIKLLFEKYLRSEGGGGGGGRMERSSHLDQSF